MFLSVKLQDDEAFERNYDQLKTYYTDTGYGARLPVHAPCQFQPSKAGILILCHCQQVAESACLAVTRSVLPQSPQANIIVGLDLLRLLVENRIAEFHTELELLSPEVGLNTHLPQ